MPSWHYHLHPARGEHVPEQEEVVDLDVRVLAHDVGLRVVLEVAEAPPVRRRALQVADDEAVRELVGRARREDRVVAEVVLQPAVLCLAGGDHVIKCRFQFKRAQICTRSQLFPSTFG